MHGLDGILVSDIRSSEDSTCLLGCSAPSVWPENSLPSVTPWLEPDFATPNGNAPSYLIIPASSPHGENVPEDFVNLENFPPGENLYRK